MYMHVCVKRSPVFRRTKPVIAHLEKREKKKNTSPEQEHVQFGWAPRGVATHKRKRCRLSARFHAHLERAREKRCIQHRREPLGNMHCRPSKQIANIYAAPRVHSAQRNPPGNENTITHRFFNCTAFEMLCIRFVLRVHSSDVVCNCCVQDPQIAHVNCNSPAIHRGHSDCTYTQKRVAHRRHIYWPTTPRNGMAYAIINQYVVDWHICANRYWPLRGYAVVECIWSTMFGANETIIFLLQKPQPISISIFSI